MPWSETVLRYVSSARTLSAARRLPGEHVEVVCRVPELRIGRHGLLAPRQAPVGRNDGRQTRHQRKRLGVGIVRLPEAYRARSHAQRVHRGHPLCRRGAQNPERSGRQLPPRAKLLPQTRQLRGVRQRVVPQQVDDFFEGRPARQLLHGETSDGELSRLPVYRAEPGLRGHHTLQAGHQNRSRIVFHGSRFLRWIRGPRGAGRTGASPPPSRRGLSNLSEHKPARRLATTIVESLILVINVDLQINILYGWVTLLGLGRRVMGEGRHLGAREAAGELGVSVATLYSYVSRGMIRSEAGGGRSRRYRAEDVRRLKERKERRRDPDSVVEGALSWGTPVLESAITLVTDDGLYYRGRDAVTLSRGSTIEEVAALIWTGDAARAASLFSSEPPELAARRRDALSVACRRWRPSRCCYPWPAPKIRPPTTCGPGPWRGRAPGSCASWRAPSLGRRPPASSETLRRGWCPRDPGCGRVARRGPYPLRRPRAAGLDLRGAVRRLLGGHAVRRGDGRAGGAGGRQARGPGRAGRGLSARGRSRGRRAGGDLRAAEARGGDSRLRAFSLPGRRPPRRRASAGHGRGLPRLRRRRALHGRRRRGAGPYRRAANRGLRPRGAGAGDGADRPAGRSRSSRSAGRSVGSGTP